MVWYVSILCLYGTYYIILNFISSIGKSFDDLNDSYDTGYNSDVDPTITNGFATAAFHFVHSMLDQDIELLDINKKLTSLRLNQHYYKPELVAQKMGLEKLLRGMVNQKSQGLDLSYDVDVSICFFY